MTQIPKLTENKEDNYQKMLQYTINILQEENETLRASIDEKQRVLDAFGIEYIIDIETQEACGRSKKFIELQNKLEEVQEKLNNVQDYINRNSGLYFDEQASKELLSIIEGQKGN